jgi:hypothetical protein
MKSFRAFIEEKNDPCWDGYEQIGMKKKNGKEVPNCVPVNEETKYVVKGKSPFYKQDHYINTHETPKSQLIKKHIKNATHMDLETAKKVAKEWESHPNKYKTEVVPVNEETEIDEATYKGREVSLNKPMPGDVKKSKVYVDPDGDGKAQKVEFGDKTLSIKKHIPARKRSYCARSSGQGNLTNKASANYWSRKAWDC